MNGDKVVRLESLLHGELENASPHDGGIHEEFVLVHSVLGDVEVRTNHRKGQRLQEPQVEPGQ